MWSWARLGVVLHTERRHARDAHAFDGEVVEVEVGHLGPTGDRCRVDAEVVVLAGDLDLSGGFVAHRVVAAMVPERQLERVAADGPAEQLMTEADTEHRHLTE